MTILQKLHKIQKEQYQQRVLYNICFRKIGVALQFYDRAKIKREIIDLIKASEVGTENTLPDNWREGLTVERYYPTLEKAIEEEYKKCIAIEEGKNEKKEDNLRQKESCKCWMKTTIPTKTH